MIAGWTWRASAAKQSHAPPSAHDTVLDAATVIGMGDRAFVGATALDDSGLTLALAPALTPSGVETSPSFFHGFATRPQLLARGLVTLADVTATRYFQYVPDSQRDPVLTAHGDRLRAECFSACNGVYARLDLLGSGFDGGEIAYGTTNVDIGMATRQVLGAVGRNETLHLDVGADHLRMTTPERTAIERKVEMPDRWVRALGNVAELHHGTVRAFELDAVAARALLASVPAATAAGRSGWLTPGRGGARLLPRRTPGSVHLAGLHRLSALRRMLPHVRGLVVHGPADGGAGPVVVQVELPDARLVLGLTEEVWRGHSGEGSLLAELSDARVADDADLVAVLLAFEPVVEVDRLVRDSGLDAARVRAALAALATSGRVGWDCDDGAWFHRELPHDPDRVEKDNPRLRAARRLVEDGAVSAAAEPGTWTVRSRGDDHRVRLDLAADDPVAGARCTCTWYLQHTGGRGPCKHVLAVWIEERP